MKYGVMFVAVLLVAALAAADIVPSAFSVSPTTFKPGVSGTLSFTVTNTGTRTISGVDLYPSGQSLQFFSEKTNLGSLGPGASSPITIPFKVASTATPGVYNIQVSAYWVDVDGEGYKTFSYPITVASSVTFQASSVRVEEAQVHPGDAFTVNAMIKNSGGAAQNVRLSSSSTLFTFGGSSQMILGDAAIGEEKQVRIPFVAGSDLVAGIYSIPLTVTYDDELGSTQTASVSLSPITVSERSIYFSVVTRQSVDHILPGQKVTVTVTLSNVGTEEARFVKVSLSPNSSSFVLLNAGEKYLERISVNGTQSVSFDLGVNAGTAPGFYPLRVSISYANTRGTEQPSLSQNIGLEVAGVSALDVISSANPAPVTPGKKHTLSLQISNTGTFQLKSVRVNVAAAFFDVLVSPDSYIGTLNVDDYSTVTYQMFTHADLAPGRYPFVATITYRDSDNVERSMTKDVYLDIVSQETAARATGTNGGTDIWFLAFIGLVILELLYFIVYKRFIKRR